MPLFVLLAMSDDDQFGLLIAGVILIGLPVYFLPTIVALARRHRNTLGIFLLNLFLGWALVGWVVALVWSAINAPATDDRPRYAEPPPAAPPPANSFPATCPACRETLRVPNVMAGRTISCGVCDKVFVATLVARRADRPLDL